VTRSLRCATVVILLGGALQPAAVTAQEADRQHANAVARADSIRSAYASLRPAGDHATDWVDVVGFPLKIIGFPIDLLLVRLPAFAIGQFTVPRAPSFFVRAFRAVGEAGVHPGIRTSIGPQSGLGTGIRIDRFDPVVLDAAFALRGSQRHRVGVRFEEGRAYGGAEVRWQRDAQAKFYGVGSRTPDDEVLFRREVIDAAASAGLPLGGPFALDAEVGYEDNFVREPLRLGDDVSIFEAFGPGELFGTEGRQRYLRLRAGVDIDLTHQAGFQRRGVALRMTGTAFRGVRDTPSDFHRLTFAGQGHLPINRRQVLSIGAQTRLTRADAGEVPFYHLAALGGRRSAIGFPSNRFRDLDMVALTAEWRYEIWRDIHKTARLETFLYFGEGAVGHRLEDIASSDWHQSYGFGFRMANVEDLLGLMYFGFSEESFHFGFSAGWQP